MKPQTPWASSISECSFFEPEANCPITYQSDVYLIYYYQMLAGREKTQPNNNKTPPNPDQENQEPLKACASTSKLFVPSVAIPDKRKPFWVKFCSRLHWQKWCLYSWGNCWLAGQPVDFRQNSGLLDLITAEELIRGTNTYQLIV